MTTWERIVTIPDDEPENPIISHELVIPNSPYTLCIVETEDGRYHAETVDECAGEDTVGVYNDLEMAKLATMREFTGMVNEWLEAVEAAL
jgi:hypothetical protein